MSTFYGTVQGNRGTATRGGSKDSGIHTSAQSWDGSIQVTLYKQEGQTYARIYVAQGSHAGGGRLLWHGPIDELLACDSLAVQHCSLALTD